MQSIRLLWWQYVGAGEIAALRSVLKEREQQIQVAVLMWIRWWLILLVADGPEHCGQRIGTRGSRQIEVNITQMA